MCLFIDISKVSAQTVGLTLRTAPATTEYAFTVPIAGDTERIVGIAAAFNSCASAEFDLTTIVKSQTAQTNKTIARYRVAGTARGKTSALCDGDPPWQQQPHDKHNSEQKRLRQDRPAFDG